MYHKMQSKSIQCPADSDEEHHPAQGHDQVKLDGETAYADEEAALLVSAKLAPEHNEENQMVSRLINGQSSAPLSGSFHANLQRKLICQKCRKLHF